MHYSHLRNLLVWLVAAPWLAGAPEPSTAGRAERPLVYSGEPGEQPLLLHGIPNEPMIIRLDAAVKRDEVRSAPGVDVRPHPFLQDVVLVTPAQEVVTLNAVAFAVPLTDGTILKFALVPAQGTGDTRVRVRRVPRLPEREALARCEGERGAALAQAVDAVAGDAAPCALVSADEEDPGTLLPSCRRVGEHAYIRIRARCPDATVGIAGSPEAGANIVFGETKCTGGQIPTCTTRLVLRKANERAGAVTVELRGRDGALCRSFSLQAW